MSDADRGIHLCGCAGWCGRSRLNLLKTTPKGGDVAVLAVTGGHAGVEEMGIWLIDSSG